MMINIYLIGWSKYVTPTGLILLYVFCYNHDVPTGLKEEPVTRKIKYRVTENQE